MKNFLLAIVLLPLLSCGKQNSADITSSIDKSYDSTNAVVTTPVDTSVVAIGTEAVKHQG
jgi:ABC-type Zn uptake system ZnuABC Zn-binding protein ZnuA